MNIQICEYDGEGYFKSLRTSTFRVAFLNYAERFDEAKTSYLERHMKTDEAFILLRGEATLIVGEAEEKLVMEKEKIYNIPCAEWHNIFVSRDAKVLVVENDDTAPENSEYRPYPFNGDKK